MTVKFEFRWNCSDEPFEGAAMYIGEYPQGRYMALEMREINDYDYFAIDWKPVPVVWNGKPDDL